MALRLWPLLLTSLPALVAAADGLPGFSSGHLKAQNLSSYYPHDSIFREALPAVAHDQGVELRLKFRLDHERWALNADYQLLGRFGDSLGLASGAEQAAFLLPPALPNDDRRWWDLTDTISDNGHRAINQRLDRLHLDYAGDKTVVRFGRQAVSWGNGLIYNPMDFFNPFDPTAVDTEYKLGDDMLYGQYLLDSGSDWQLVSVARRDEAGEVEAEVGSSALKFHGFALEHEYDLLLAQHYDETVVAAGATSSVGGAVLRADVVLTDAQTGWEAMFVANGSYSWEWGGHNVSGVVEYFFNGFGLRESDYSLERLAQESDLLDRLNRGELFTLGRHYLATSVQIEWTPLVNFSPNLFINLGDGSALAQLTMQWDLSQNWQLLGAINLPVGPSGTEYGGLEAGGEQQYLSSGGSLFAQLAWYF